MSEQNHYQTLGIVTDADRRTVRNAYRRALRRYHPDANAGSRNGERMLQRVIEAGRVLGNPQLRAQYDAQLGPPPKPTHRKPATQPAASLFWQRVLLTCRRLGRRFFTAEHAAATEARAANRRRTKPVTADFSYHLDRALRSNSANRYRCGADGIWRKKEISGTPHHANWWKRSTTWLVIGIGWWWD